MKKIFFSIVLAASMSGLLSAQDTLPMKSPKSNYYCNMWIDTTGCFYYNGRQEYSNTYIAAKQHYTKDTMQVYGIVSIVVDELFDYEPSTYFPDSLSYLQYLHRNDPTLDSCETSLMLYQYYRDSSGGGNMIQLGEPLPVHTVDTPVSYWLKVDMPSCNVHIEQVKPMPVYERYFSDPQTVYGTFYTGYTQNNSGYDTNGRWRESLGNHPLVTAVSFRNGTYSYNFTDSMMCYRQRSPDESPEWYPQFLPSEGVIFMYPILTPNPELDTTVTSIDTTVGPDSTLTGIGKVDMVGRYVSVSPNPAGDRATVVSSFGLTAIEAYDPQGRQLYTAPATGLKAELDVSAWPRGTVLLHIHTPAGTTVKKLLLR